METSLHAADDINLVSISDSSSVSSCNDARKSCHSQMHTRRYMLILVILIVIICLVLLTFIIVILVVLLHQQAAISSLGTRIQALQISGRNLEKGLVHISKVFLIPFEEADQMDAYNQPAKNETLDGRSDTQHKKRNSFNKLQNSYFFMGDNESRLDKEIQSARSALVARISNEVLENVISYLSNRTKEDAWEVVATCIDNWHSLKTETHGLHTTLGDVLTSIREVQVQEETRHNVTKDLLKDIANQPMMDTVSRLSNMLRRALRNITMVHKRQNVMKFVTEVDTNIKQMNTSMIEIERYLNSLEEEVLRVENLLLLTSNRTTNMSVTVTPGVENATLCLATPPQRLALQDKQIMENIMNITEVQLPALFHSQADVLTELNGQFPFIREQLNHPDVEWEEKGEFHDLVGFCYNENSCSRFHINLKHCYKVSGPLDPPLTWQQARDKCQQLGGYLLEIDSNLEMREVERFADRSQAYWLGGTDVEKEDLWIWQHSRYPIILNTWLAGEPNNAGTEHCLQSVKGIGNWNDVPCSLTMRYICERNDGRCWE